MPNRLPLRGSQLRAAAIISATTLLSVVLIPAATGDDLVHFTQTVAQDCVTDALGVARSAAVTVVQAQSITQLHCSAGGSWESLADLEQFPNLESLNIYGSFWDDAENDATGTFLSPIASLTNLTTLVLNAQVLQPLDYSPLHSLTKLESLTTYGWSASTAGQIAPMPSLKALRMLDRTTSLEGIGGFENLEHLTVDAISPEAGEQVPLEPVAALHNLKTFYSHGNAAAGDLSAFADMPHLTSLEVYSDGDASLAGLAESDALETLVVKAQGLSDDDLAVAAALPLLSTLNLGSGSISDLTPLTGNTTLTHLAIWGADLTDISLLATLPNLSDVGLSENHISDLTPLQDLPLTMYYALDQTYDLGTVNACDTSAAFVITDRVGKAHPLLPSEYRGASNGASVVWSVDGNWSAHADDGNFSDPIFTLSGEHFSGTGSVTVLPSASPCPWSTGLTITTPDEFITNQPFAAELTWAQAVHPNYNFDWIDSDNKVVGEGENYTSGKAGIDVRARITPTTPGFDSAPVVSAPVHLAAQMPATMAITITGTPQPDFTLTVVESNRPVDVGIGYQWLRDGVPVPANTGIGYQVTDADVGHVITVRGTATSLTARYWPETLVSPPVTVQGRSSFTSIGIPHVSGSPIAGGRLTVAPGTWAPGPVGVQVQWLRNGKAIPGAHGSTYSPKSSDLGAKIAAKVTASATGFNSVTRTSASVTIIRSFIFVNAPTVSGSARVGSTLTATAGTSSPSATSTYQWYRNGVAISGATHRTYTAKARDAYASIAVKATAKRTGYFPVTKTSKSKVPTGLKYSSCAALRKAYPGGVAKSSNTPGVRSNTFVSSKLYALNSARDGDKDGWACESS